VNHVRVRCCTGGIGGCCEELIAVCCSERLLFGRGKPATIRRTSHGGLAHKHCQSKMFVVSRGGYGGLGHWCG